MMPAGEDWSLTEISATVFDYMAMLQLELAGQPYNKSAHRRALLARLSGRSEAAVELKHQNISAVLRDLGYFWIPGYKPRSNYQAALAEEVERCVRITSELDRHATAAAEAPAAVPEFVDFARFEEPRPVSTNRVRGAGESPAPYESGRAAAAVRPIRDYAAREAYNSSLGRAGEELVVRFEQHRLIHAGLGKLAERVEHVARTQGDGLGFDVLSFDLEGRERFIEVKTTRFAKETPFYISSGEVRFARQNPDRFSLCRVFDFRREPRCFTLPGRVEDHCTLDPVSFRCSVATS